MTRMLNLKDLSPEVLLIFELLKEQNEQSIQINTKRLCENINWHHFLELTLHHRVFPVLYSKIKLLGENTVPLFVAESLRQYYKNNTFRMLQLSAEMEQVSILFSAQQIKALFLKGPVLAQDLYGDISLRTSSDIDFIVPIQSLEEAEELLVRRGYQKDDYIETVLEDWRWRHHHVTYFHPEKKIKLEIHWRMHPGPGREPTFQELWKRKRQSSLTGSPVYLLGKEDLFLYLISHGARHGWSRLRWLVDIQQMMKQEINWKMVCELFKIYHNINVAGQAVILAAQLLHSSVHEELKPLLSVKRSQQLAQEAIFYLERMVNLHTDPVPLEISKYHARHLFSLMSAQQKCFYILSFLHPYPEDARILPLPKRLHILYYPLRPFLWAWRKRKKPALS
ncbi:nucleotidyltransferase family protein [Domibacillus sp.]|uniref:nucleotidyltransferase domain-containing protein n=1 Tax=Domibacillus sp. TaxID=1969783 RepID=UPI00281285C6|nr:nucleotidyltransferase family protein [Domibacillus sp.]